MPYSTPISYEQEDQDGIPLKWIIIFVLLSLLAHVVLIACMIILSKHIPTPRLEPKEQNPTVALTLIPPPQPVVPPAPKHIFMTTPEQKNAPHRETLVESDHDAQLASHSKVSRKNDTIMPDVVSKDEHPSSLQSSPSAPPSQKPESTPTPPTPKQQQAKPSPTPPQPPQPQQTKAEPSKTPPQPTKTPPPPTPTQTPPPKVPPPPAVDANGLPVLPMLNAPTMAPQTSANAQQAQQASPPPMMPVVPANVQGHAGMSGAPSPDAMQTDLGKYKALFYQAVGSRWYPKVSQQMQLIGVGRVVIEYTISPEGIVTYRVIDDGGGNMTILSTISQNSIQGVSPFRPFPPSMLKEYPNGYTDQFSFSVY